MKLLNCTVCHDIIRLHVDEERACRCGRSHGQHKSAGVTATYSGPARLMGMMSLDYFRATPGKRYPWFLLPEPPPDSQAGAKRLTETSDLDVSPTWQVQLRTLAAESREIVEHDDGFALAFPSLDNSARALADFALSVRRSFPFSVELGLASGEGPAWLRLRGQPAAKEQIRAALSET